MILQFDVAEESIPVVRLVRSKYSKVLMVLELYDAEGNKWASGTTTTKTTKSRIILFVL